jgi:amino-acid N-acetyltransferase
VKKPAATLLLRQGRPDDWPAVGALLADAGLPVDDLDPASMPQFTIASRASKRAEALAGVIGLQSFDKVGLLRSLVVATSARSAGCGSKLVQAVERNASEAGVRELWLLTMDARGYFENRGFRAVSRETAPPAIRLTAEFTSLCPDSAVLMMKTLRP